MELREILQGDTSFRYRLLGRHKADCDYFLGWGNKNTSRLWSGNVRDHIQNMKDLFNSFQDGEKPRWLPYKKILKYEFKMLYCESFNKEATTCIH